MGMPIVTRNKITVKPKNHDRRASPLIFRVLRNGQHTYQWTVLKLSGRILPPGERIEARFRQQRGPVPAITDPGRGIVDEFFEYAGRNDGTEKISL